MVFDALFHVFTRVCTAVGFHDVKVFSVVLVSVSNQSIFK